ncbi:MAG: sigma-70 family RNA polymerase sigma factor [Treponema sp.]|jgi:RNA polymerase sigma-70 factor (ECF subfamily)|nr:sigma-70 family RNA polymerase sigma factor [Treponema sp.]
MKNNPAAGIARSIENALQQRRDAVLVKESIAGDAGAFAKLMSLYQNRVEAVGMSFFHNHTDTEDFVQDVFLKAYTSLTSFRGESRFSTWLTRIAYNMAINIKARSKTYDSIADETLLPSPGRTPEENEIRRLTAEAIKEALRELPEQYAACLDFYFFHDMSYDEIAAVTDMPLNTIKSHIFRAKKILRRKLSEFV